MTESKIFELKPIKFKECIIEVRGTTPFISHNWSEKAKKEMLDKQMGKKVEGKGIRNPMSEFIESLYWLTEKPKKHTDEAFEECLKNGAKFGFKATGFKKALVTAPYRCKVTKDIVSSKGNIYIYGDYNDLLEIEGVPMMREDMVRIGNGSADLRYRACFNEWKASLKIKYNSDVLTPEMLVHFLNLAGFCCGIGDWRVEKNGQFGMFEVTKVINIE